MYKKKMKEAVISEATHMLSITDYQVSFIRDRILIEIKSPASKLARNALHRLAAAAYRFTQGRPVVFPGKAGRDAAPIINEYFERAELTDVAVNNEGYSEYKHTVTDPDDFFNDIDSISLYVKNQLDQNKVRLLLTKIISVTKARMEKEEEKLTVHDYVWESEEPATFTKGDSFDKNDFKFITGDVFDLKSKEAVDDVLKQLEKNIGEFTAFKTKSGGTIYLITSNKVYSLTSNSGWFSLLELTYDKVKARIEKEQLAELT
jgi:hypothetical protein